ncbi:MAG: hypothetical protein AAGC91_03980 [Pseudomonadota bacterium]
MHASLSLINEHCLLGAHSAIDREIEVMSLSEGSRLSVWSVRQWIVETRANRCVGCALSDTFKRFACVAAVQHIDQFMMLLTRHAITTVELRPSSHPTLSQGERTILRILQSAQLEQDAPTALTAAAQLVGTNARSLFDAAKQYSNQLSAVRLNMASFRTLGLVKHQPQRALT